ncbi:uncharacterized protein LACBIDRAFT_320994 [Laccaria bicolor S238N-H82]|uniref:Predicted protein n=1 Tax=Laccaria bicolor (strain S238N-H82 / ATCC MYA-4686) TaxID=486041 RepID=B0CNF6_LACBS|nr:uncharacterized protein LACBIDRAFT_320994 [Laccaria bicolor S238N-H82]EDR15920.1 predicted protein [Laccaria bicolor S238N-H82]|eukprot:XP_001874128.1 predicted protein [Laccaria bicolor S238N-H82]
MSEFKSAAIIVWQICVAIQVTCQFAKQWRRVNKEGKRCYCRVVERWGPGLQDCDFCKGVLGCGACEEVGAEQRGHGGVQEQSPVTCDRSSRRRDKTIEKPPFHGNPLGFRGNWRNPWFFISFNSTGPVTRDRPVEILVSTTTQIRRDKPKIWAKFRPLSAAGHEKFRHLSHERQMISTPYKNLRDHRDISAI